MDEDNREMMCHGITMHINTLMNSISYRFNNVLIDPGDEWEGMSDVETILLTHAHFDHIYGLNNVIEKNPNAKVYTNDYGAEMLVNSKKNLSTYHESPFTFRKPENIAIVKHGDKLDVSGYINTEAIFTPGHNPSCITWLIGDCLFTGDSYIPGIKTVTNLPGADKEAADNSEKKLLELGTSYTIYPGHHIRYLD